MNKETCLELLKSLVLQLRDNSDELKTNFQLQKDFVVKYQLLNQHIKSLNSCESDWLNDQYGEFFKKEIEPYIKKLPSDLFNKIS